LNSATVCSLAEEEEDDEGGGEEEEEEDDDDHHHHHHLKGNELHRAGQTALNLQSSCS